MAVTVHPAEVRVTVPSAGTALAPGIRKALLERLAVFQIGIIRRRTKRGLDVNGKPLAPYSPAYAKKREEAGYQTSPTDLWLTGSTLNHMQIVKSDDTEAVIGFVGSAPATRFRSSKPRPHRKVPGKLVTKSVRRSRTKMVANALKAFWLQYGRKPRNFFGASPQDLVLLAREAARILGIK